MDEEQAPDAAPDLQPQSQATSESYSVPVAVPTESPEDKAARRARLDASLGNMRAATNKANAGEQASGAEFGKVTDRYKAGAEQIATQDQALRDKYIAPLAKEAEDANTAHQDAVASREDYRAKVRTQLEQMDTMSKQIAAEQPHDFWADQSTGFKVAAIAALALGGAAQALNGDRTNAVADQIDNLIKRDITMQRLRLEKGKEDYGNRNLLLGKFMEEGEHTQNAQDRAYVTAMDGIKGRLEVNKQLLADPTMRMNMLQTITQLDMKSAEAKMRIMQDTGGRDVKMAQAEAVLGEKAEQTGSALGVMRAQTAQRNAAVKEGQLSDKLKQEGLNRGMVGWEGDYLGKDADNFRKKDTAIQNAVRILDTYAEQAGKGYKNFTSFQDYDKLKQSFNQAVTYIKGPALANTGANFTELESKLIKAGFLAPDRKVLLDPKGAAEMIKDAEMNLLTDLETDAKTHGLKAKGHPLLGGE